MKIDVHVHTRKVKSGDAETRNIEAEKFGEILKNSDVKILAITNHNHFDLKQFEEFSKIADNGCQIWPGIELDILENGKRAHLIVIVNPKNSALFNEKVNSIIDGKNPDSFTIPLNETVQAFDDLDCIYIAHYFAKKPDLDDQALETLYTLVSNPKRILKEATNSLSAGIYISHGHNSIYGSDVHDWADYLSLSKQLPELRLPVQSYEQFCLLLEKDEATIDTLLNRKVKEPVELDPFGIAELIKIEIYNDINILFGSKGTGKSIILDALSKYFNGKGHKTSVYKSNDKHLNDVFDLKGNLLSISLSELGIDKCQTEIDFIRKVTEEEVTSLSKYLLHFDFVETNKISQQLKIQDIVRADEKQPKRKLDDVHSVLESFRAFRNYIDEEEKLNDYINTNLVDELITVLEKILTELGDETENHFLDYNSTLLLNGIIGVFQLEISKKTNQPQKPAKTGFAKYAGNRIKIERATNKIIDNIKSNIEPIIVYAGSLGLKGELYCQTKLLIHNGSISNGNFSPVKNINKTPQRDFALKINSISKHIYSNDLFEKISDLNDITDIEKIESLDDLMLFYRHFIVDNKLYKPSHGESSMLLLHMELQEDKDIYLIDEPEKSLGNDYINDVIVPILREKAQLGKKVIIATHDANIAVRTLPYNSIYRLHDKGLYYTLTGNPFSNKLKCVNNTRPELDWKEISMKTLEGGEEAFGERGKIYGKQ